jgi:AcrR family transcriptional regulator
VPKPDATAPTVVDDDELRAADGRVPGRRGKATRQKLLACTAAMLAETSYREVKVVDIARAAGTSPATFYQYVPDVESAILVLAEDLSRDGAALADVAAEQSWRGKSAYPSALAVVDAFLDFWDRNRPVLRVLDLLSEEGDQRFYKVRSSLLTKLTRALADALVETQRDKAPPIDPMAQVGVVVAMLSNVARHRFGFEFWGIKGDATRQSMARLLAWAVSGQKPASA